MENETKEKAKQEEEEDNTASSLFDLSDLEALAGEEGELPEKEKIPSSAEEETLGTAEPEQPVSFPTTDTAKEASPGMVSTSFFDTDLRQALQDIGMAVGKTIIPTLDVSAFVSCELNNATLEEALSLVLAGTGYSYKEKENYILVYSTSTTNPNFLDISETKKFKLNYIYATSAVNLLPPQLREYIQTDDALKTNELLVTAPPEMMQRIEKDLALIDQPPKQIMLDVRVVIIEANTLFQMGVKWDWPSLTAGIASNSDLHELAGAGPTPWPWGIEIGYTPGKEFTNALNLTLDLLGQNDQALVLANPQVMALDGEESQIKVTKEEYFEILTKGYYTSSQLEKVEAGTTLTITPMIGDSQDITMQINAEVSDVVSRGGNNLPVVTRRVSTSTVRVEDGGTAAIAGLFDNRSNANNQKVPGLGHIPILGEPFRSRRKETSSRQIAIFVSPRVVHSAREYKKLERDKKTDYIDPVSHREFKKELEKVLREMSGGGNDEE